MRLFFGVIIHYVRFLDVDSLDGRDVPVFRRAADGQQASVRSGHELVEEPRRF
jgi:hypothetical protein